MRSFVGSRDDGVGRVALGALLVCAGAFLGSSVVGSLRFGASGPAILFPPYAVLTAALMLSPVRRWWVYLLACSVGSFVPHLAISPIQQILAAEVANYAKAIVAAAGMRFLVGVPRDLGNHREMAWLLVCAGGAGPIVGAFIGAFASTKFGGGSSYWQAWRGWAMSNSVTGVTLLPAIVATVDVVRNRARWPSLTRLLEAGIVGAALFAVGFQIFSVGSRSSIVLPSRLCWLLPFVLWAAVRFGPAGTGLALCGLTGISAWGTAGGHGPFAAAAPAESVLELQFFLITAAIPLLLLTALLTQQRSTAAALRHSEAEARRRAAQLATIYRTAPVGLAFIDTDLRYVDLSDELARQNGVSADRHLGRTLRDVLPAEIIDEVEANYQQVISTGSPLTDVEFRSPSDDRQWLVDYHPVNNADGQFLGVSTVVQDVTERRRSEETLRASNQRTQDLAGRLIHAQESERSRIARELHDDVDQQLAAISLALSALRRTAPADPHLQGEIEAVQQSAIEAAESVRQLSHELHPGVLRHAGLLPALKSYCSEFRARHGIGLTLQAGDGVDALATTAGPDVALCLYRAAQEALGNVARHSGARNATLRLDRCATGDGIEMCVEDDGRGFDVEAVREAGGLGLLSIDERVRLVRGTSTIERRPEGGTTLRLTVPLRGVTDDDTADRAACG